MTCKLMWYFADTDCCTRQCLGVMRPFEMMITDNQGQQLIKLDRPCRCQGSCCWCCYLQEMDIQSPPGVVVGKIEEMQVIFLSSVSAILRHHIHTVFIIVFSTYQHLCFFYHACWSVKFFRFWQQSFFVRTFKTTHQIFTNKNSSLFYTWSSTGV